MWTPGGLFLLQTPDVFPETQITRWEVSDNAQHQQLNFLSLSATMRF